MIKKDRVRACQRVCRTWKRIVREWRKVEVE